MALSIVCWSLVVATLFQSFKPAVATRPILSGLPTDIYVGELETGTRLLYTFTASDPDSDSFTCSITIDGELAGAAVTDNDNEYIIKRNTQSGHYELWSNSATYDDTVIDTYAVSITCIDSNSETSTGNNKVNVKVQDNALLTINNVEGAANELTVDALGTDAETVLKTVSSSQTGGGPVEYTFTSDPSFFPEYFKIDNSTGIIKTNRHLETLDTNFTTIKAVITARDTVSNIVVTATQTIHMNNQNTVPTTTNMITPLTRTELESLAAGTTLFTVSVADPDAGQTHTYRMTCTPEAVLNLFELDTSGNFMIAAGQTLDYETVSSITCEFYIHDGIEEGGPFYYILTVGNDNDAPVFDNTMHYVTASEGSKGSVSFDPGFVCTDEDSGDTTTYEFTSVNNSDRFAVDSSGIMTFNTDYDIDGSSAYPVTVVLTACCKDSGHINGASKSACAQVTVTISDVNDNEPTFSSPSYTFTVDQTAAVGTVVGSLAPTDIDYLATNRNPTCDGTSSTGACFSIGADCNVYVACSLETSCSSYSEYVVQATDTGNPQQTGTTTVGIICQETTTTTTTATTTTEAYNFFDHGVNIFLFVLSLLMGLLLLGLLTWCCLRLCCGGACGGSGAMCRNMCDCGYQGRARRSNRHQPRRAVTPEQDSPRPRTRIKEEAPRKIIQEQRPVQVIRSVGRSPYASLRQIPMKYPIRSAPLPPGYFP